MFEKSAAAKRLDRIIWGSVGLFITGYTCWHFNLLPTAQQFNDVFNSKNQITVADQQKEPDQDREFNPTQLEESPFKKQAHKTTNAEPLPEWANHSSGESVTVAATQNEQQEPDDPKQNEFNNIWQKFDQNEQVKYKRKTDKKANTSTPSQPEGNQLKQAEYEPVLLSPPDYKNPGGDSYLEQSEPHNKQIAPAVHEEPKSPEIINPWEQEGTMQQVSGKQEYVQRRVPHYNDVMKGNMSYNPERNKTRAELIPGYQQGTNQGDIRFVNNQQMNDQPRGSTSPAGSPPLQKAENQPLLQQPVNTLTPQSPTTKNITPQDEVLRLRELSQVYWSQPNQRKLIDTEINQLSKKIFFEKGVHYLPSHKIAPGEQLTKIAKKYDVPWEFLARLNQVNPAKIRAGDTLKVQQGPFSAIVDLSDYELTIHSKGYYVCRFTVGVGKNGSTPQGKFKVKNKEVNPVYYGPEKVIDRDDPENPLGERWLDLGDSYGIHGTNEPDSIGKAASKGCIRMKNADVELVYDLLIIGSEVTIQD